MIKLDDMSVANFASYPLSGYGKCSMLQEGAVCHNSAFIVYKTIACDDFQLLEKTDYTRLIVPMGTVLVRLSIMVLTTTGTVGSVAILYKNGQPLRQLAGMFTTKIQDREFLLTGGILLESVQSGDYFQIYISAPQGSLGGGGWFMLENYQTAQKLSLDGGHVDD